jgi:hypothetical protein
MTSIKEAANLFTFERGCGDRWIDPMKKAKVNLIEPSGNRRINPLPRIGDMVEHVLAIKNEASAHRKNLMEI